MNTMSATLTFKLVGTEKDGHAVQLGDARQFLDSVADCLRRTEKRTKGTTAVKHLITGATIASLTMTTTAVSPADDPEAGPEVYETFKRVVSAIETGESVDPRFLDDDLKAFRELAKPVLNGKKRVEIAGTPITTQFAANIDKLLGDVTHSKGTVKGRIERVNVHGCHEFALYPPIGTYVVLCTFKADQFDDVQRALKRSVTVHGLLTYRGDSPYPVRVQVDRIELHPLDDELPTLASLRGLMPNATGGKAITEFTQTLRDE